MHRTTFVLLLLVVNLPMAAEEVAAVTVHQAEWGDTRGEAPPPSGPSVPVKAIEAMPGFRSQPFQYGQGLRYSSNWGMRYGVALRYRPGTQLRRLHQQVTGSQYQMNGRYKGAGRRMRNGYKPNMKYGSGTYLRNRGQYGFNR